MKERYKNPHPFDMSLYYSGDVVVIGGRDFEADDIDNNAQNSESLTHASIELDWSQLLSGLPRTPKAE